MDENHRIFIPSQDEEDFEFLTEYFDVKPPSVEKTGEFESLDDEQKVIVSVLLGQLNYLENDSRDGFEPVELGEAVGWVKDGELSWNYYAVIRRLEKKGILYRLEGGEYVVHRSEFDKIVRNLS